MHHVKTYTITFIPEGAGYRAICLALSGTEAIGATKEEALERIEDLIRTRVADAVARRQPVPIDRTSTKFLWINLDEFLV